MLAPDPEQPRYRITLRALPGGESPPATRLKLALKVLLRRFGLKCEFIEEVKPLQEGSRDAGTESNPGREDQDR
jgi:hypothetical protein